MKLEIKTTAEIVWNTPDDDNTIDDTKWSPVDEQIEWLESLNHEIKRMVPDTDQLPDIVQLYNMICQRIQQLKGEK
jgi:hypothetical protein